MEFNRRRPVRRSLVGRIEDYISALLVIVTLDELTSGIVDHDSFSRLAGCDLQKEVMDGLTFSSTRIAQEHDVLGLICEWNRNPCWRFFNAKIASHAGNHPPS